MLSFLIARDTMHQNQWMAVLEELEDMAHASATGLPAGPREAGVQLRVLRVVRRRCSR